MKYLQGQCKLPILMKSRWSLHLSLVISKVWLLAPYWRCTNTTLRLFHLSWFLIGWTQEVHTCTYHVNSTNGLFVQTTRFGRGWKKGKIWTTPFGMRDGASVQQYRDLRTALRTKLKNLNFVYVGSANQGLTFRHVICLVTRSAGGIQIQHRPSIHPSS